MSSDESGGENQGNGSASQVFSGAVVVFAGLVLELGFAFLAQVVVARYLGTVSYGAVSIGLTVLTFAVTFSLLGLNTGLTRNIPQADDVATERGLLWSGLGIGTGTAVVIGAVLVVAAPVLADRVFNEPQLVPILRIFGVVLPFAVFFRIGIGAIKGYSITKGRVYVQNITLPVTRMLGVVAVLVVGAGVVGAAGAYAVAYVAGAVVTLWLLYRHTPTFSGGDTTFETRSLLVYSLPLLVSSSMTQIYSDVDVILLGGLAVGTGSVGIYRAVYPLSKLLLMPGSAFGFLYLPQVSGLHGDGELKTARELFQTVSKWIALTGVPIFVFFQVFPQQLIGLTFGGEYVTGVDEFRVLAATFFIPLLVGPNTETLMAFGYTRFTAIVDAAMAIANVVLNFLLIPEFGIMGAAVATAVSYFCQNSLYSTYLYVSDRIHPFSIGMVFPIVAGLSGGAIIIVASALFDVGLVGRIVAYLTVLVVFVASIFAYSIGSEEIEIVGRIDDRIGTSFAPRLEVFSRP